MKFNLVSLVSLGVSFATFIALTLFLPRVPVQIDQLAGIVPATLVNYFLNSYWTFRAHPEPERDAGESLLPQEPPRVNRSV